MRNRAIHRHLVNAITRLSKSTTFRKRLYYGCDTRSFEDWLTFEIGAAASWRAYWGRGSRLYAWPEHDRMDLPFFIEPDAENAVAVAELKMAWGLGRKGLENTVRKGLIQLRRGGNIPKTLLVCALVSVEGHRGRGRNRRAFAKANSILGYVDELLGVKGEVIRIARWSADGYYKLLEVEIGVWTGRRLRVRTRK